MLRKVVWRLRKRHAAWPIVYAVATGAFVVGVIVIVKFSGYTASEAIYLLTGIVLMAYTIETWRLRREAQPQTELPSDGLFTER
jgi:uncharacterized membrane protein YfcA